MKRIIFQIFFFIITFSVVAGTAQISNSSVINNSDGNRIKNSTDGLSKSVSGIQSRKVNIKDTRIVNTINGTIENNALNDSYINSGVIINGSEITNSVIKNTAKGKIDIKTDNNSLVNAGILAENIKIINSKLNNLVYDSKVEAKNGANVNCGIKLS